MASTAVGARSLSKLLVVIVDFQVTELVEECLASLKDQIAAVEGARVVVVENSGHDAEVALLGRLAARGWVDWVTVVTPTENLGFAGGNNIAIRPALASDKAPEYVLLLNPDTLVTPDAIGALLRFMDAHPEAGIAGSRLEFPDGSQQASPFRFPGLATELDSGLQFGPISRILRPWAICAPKPAVPAPVDWVAGASMMVRREVFESAGLLDERFFTYFEDVDYCLNARRAGWSTWYVPKSRVIHLEGQSSGVTGGALDGRPDYWLEARRHYFIKNHGRLRAALIDAAFLTSCLLGQFLGIIRGKAAVHTRKTLMSTLRYAAFRS